jgi:replication-associated recombination protein RarA
VDTLKERYRPRSLRDVVGQPIALQLAEIARNPRPRCLLLEGPTGCGKSTCAQALAHDLGCYADPFFEAAYTVCGADFNAEAVRRYFGPETPFRFKLPSYNGHPGFYVLMIEELEEMHKTVQVLCKDALERALRRYNVIVAATSNDSSRLDKAVRHRFDHYHFSAGDTFAMAINDWLPKIWGDAVGAEVNMPYGWQQFGWDGEEFSARLALDRLEKFVLLEQRSVGVAV